MLKAKERASRIKQINQKNTPPKSKTTQQVDSETSARMKLRIEKDLEAAKENKSE
eukprot:TRINITY_DN4033_c0_g1_i1.p2 TRINITY_DN4033_c0_g1~~TRINITY_DN4033_c0_g1_i1.p2  ORF type:complete len:55 (-),score=4.93 TRINITY_DN4033_c0_g1_i1:52-216(-)